MEERAVQLAQYIIENRATVRSAAAKFGISKSTVHKDIQDRLPAFNRPLYLQVREVLDENTAQRHIRGGIAIVYKTLGRLLLRAWAGHTRAKNAQPAHRQTKITATEESSSSQPPARSTLGVRRALRALFTQGAKRALRARLSRRAVLPRRGALTRSTGA